MPGTACASCRGCASLPLSLFMGFCSKRLISLSWRRDLRLPGLARASRHVLFMNFGGLVLVDAWACGRWDRTVP